MTKRAHETPRVALSVRQPWAWTLLFGGKDVENRTWSTRCRGRIWIHASKREIAEDVDYAVRLVAEGWDCDPNRALEHYREHDQRGAILGSLNLTGCRLIDELPADDPLRNNLWAQGPWLWLLEDPVVCDPWPMPGRLSLWTPPPARRPDG